MNLIEAILPVNFQKGRKGTYSPDCIVIHVTEGDYRSVISWFRNPAANVSAHYMVTRTGDVYHFVHEYDTAWANGRVDHPTAELVLERPGSNPNNWTISIENEGNGKEELTTTQRASLLELIKDIQKRHPLILSDRRHIVGHHEIYSLKTCPGAISVDRIVREVNTPPDFSDVTGGSSSTAPQ